eukprot:8669323-Pyramimonas_sp.AAC.1
MQYALTATCKGYQRELSNLLNSLKSTYSPRVQVAIRYIERNERGSAGDAWRIGQWIGRPLRIFRG